MQHPWVVGDDAELEKRDLGANMDKLRLFNARRKFKSAISSVSEATRSDSKRLEATRSNANLPYLSRGCLLKPRIHPTIDSSTLSVDD